MTRRYLIALLTLTIAFAAFAEDQAVCAVCGPREGSGFEPVKARAKYKGKEYAFCSLECKVEFLKDPEAFLATDEGKPAPAFALRTLDGAKVSLGDYRGKVLLLDFWGTFCPPCVAALPELQALHAKYSGSGFAVIGMTVDERLPMVRKATGAAKVTYPILQATAKEWSAYKVNALPSLVLVGRDGKIVKRYGGEADRAAMIAEIEKAIAR
ncbi:MAG TPA: redoxin family protein [Thermoanaerobaculia bacterium]|nr:redoxin family protein [Thermoanaerobaculia bacterium]